jgi:hypothetical protein
MATGAAGPDVLLCSAVGFAGLKRIAGRYGVELAVLPAGAAIPGTYWGAPEAGLVGNRLYLRSDTPVHSAMHELSHYVCASAQRRATLDTDAGGSDIEECGVCYLQLALASELAGFGRNRALADMDAWGYSFREGSAAAWLAGDGRDARDWLSTHGLIDQAGRPTWQLRGARGTLPYEDATRASSSSIARR